MAHFVKREESPLQLQRKLQKAGQVLGFTRNQEINGSIVRKRFLELVSAMHPDAHGTENTQPQEFPTPQADLDQIRRAKDLLIKHMEGADDDAA